MSNVAERMAHTPGPWTMDANQCVKSPDGTCVVCAGHDYDDYGGIFNDGDKALIVAAPELLAALKALTDEIFGVSDIDESVRDVALAAIANAEKQP
jgi:hypothetical protein